MRIRLAASLALALAPLTASAQRYQVLPLKGTKPPVAQPAPTAPAASSKTTVRVELLTGRLGAGLKAQEWGRVFRDIGFDGRVRPGLTTDKLGVKETKRGRLREIVVVGRLERDGTARFADRKIRPADAARLKEWLVELQTFGAQGTPEGKPLWGLSRAQFDLAHNALATKTADDLVGMPFVEVLPRLATPRSLPLRISEDARAWLQRVPREAKVRTSTKGFTKGTALALLLREHGFGMRPTRTPAGSTELVVEPLPKTEDVWPAGWPFQGSRQEKMPKMFAFTPVSLQDSALSDVLDGIATRAEVPIVVDRHGIAEAGIAFDELRVTYPPKRTTWSLLLRNVLGPHKLIREFRRDEAGRVFCWVTVFRPRRVGED